jgi:hypothetical protein
MEKPMNKEDEVIGYDQRFLDLAEPLFDSHWLDGEECDALFWYEFHPEDCAMILGRFHPQQTRTPQTGVPHRARHLLATT